MSARNSDCLPRLNVKFVPCLRPSLFLSFDFWSWTFSRHTTAITAVEERGMGSSFSFSHGPPIILCILPIAKSVSGRGKHTPTVTDLDFFPMKR